MLVCGAGGFIGRHFVRRLKNEGYWVRGVDIKYPEFSKTVALGVRSRNSDKKLIRTMLGWELRKSLEEDLKKTYMWTEAQVQKG